jgi:dTMP kinase
MLIAFSGLDGAGKSTQIAILAKALRDKGRSPVVFWSRGGYTPLFNGLKSLARRVTGGKALPPGGRTQARSRAFTKPFVRFAWLRLALLDLLFTYGVRLRWWLAAGRTVVCDRYIWDTLIDFRLNFPLDPVEKSWLWRLLVWAAPVPGVSFLLVIPVEESLRRSQAKKEPFPDSAEVLAARLEQYLSLCSQAGWIVLDGAQSVETVSAQIIASLPDPSTYTTRPAS